MLRSYKLTHLVIIGVMTILFTYCGQPKINSQVFLTKAKDLGDILVKQAAGDMNVCNMYNTVWEYAKVTDMDFKSAYREMMMDTSGIKTQSDSNMQMMDRLMNTIKRPPKGVAGIQNKLVELRESYLEFNKFVFKIPQVSQEKFNAEADAYIANINSLKDELNGLIAEVEANL